MPGFLETTIHQGYGYLEQTGYVEKARPYVEKARNAAFAVPLVERAATKAEQIVPQLLTRADELAEPSIVRMRPYVEPRIEQVKETVTPYVNKGVEKYGVLHEEGVKYYNTGLEKVEQIKEFKDAKTTQIKDFKDQRITQVKDFKEAGTTKIREFADPKVEMIREFTDPKVQKIRSVVKPRKDRVGAALTAKKIQAQKLLRVPKSTDLQCLTCETLLGKVASGLSKAEALIGKYLPLPEEQRDSDSDSSVASDSSYTKINKSLTGIRSRLWFALMIKIRLLLSSPLLLKAAYADGTLKEKVVKSITDVKSTMISKVEYAKMEAKKHFVTLKEFVGSLNAESPKSFFLRIKTVLELQWDKAKIAAEPKLKKASEKLVSVIEKVAEKVAPIVSALSQNSQFKKAVQIAVLGAEKALGKEKTERILSKLYSFIPSAKCEPKAVGKIEVNQSKWKPTAPVVESEPGLRKREGKKGRGQNDP